MTDCQLLTGHIDLLLALLDGLRSADCCYKSHDTKVTSEASFNGEVTIGVIIGRKDDADWTLGTRRQRLRQGLIFGYINRVANHINTSSFVFLYHLSRLLVAPTIRHAKLCIRPPTMMIEPTQKICTHVATKLYTNSRTAHTYLRCLSKCKNQS